MFQLITPLSPNASFSVDPNNLVDIKQYDLGWFDDVSDSIVFEDRIIWKGMCRCVDSFITKHVLILLYNGITD